MAFRLLDPNPQYRKADGSLCDGGTLNFFETDNTTPKDAYAEKELSTNLGSSITLNAAARSPTDVWLEGPYSVQLLTSVADGAEQVWLREDVQDVASGGITALDPADGTDGQFYGTDGVDADWYDVRQVADPTGHSGKYYGNDGEAHGWYSFPAATVYDEDNLPGGIEQTATTFRIGNILVQTGTGSAPGPDTSNKTSVGITFAVAYDSTPIFVGVTPNIGVVTDEGAHVSTQATGLSASGFTATFFAGAEDGGGDLDINTAVPFQWIAFGIKAP